MDVVPYGGWDRCLRLTDGDCELIATLEVGPRIIRFGFRDGDNHFSENRDQLGKTGGDDYRSYGGHRLWIAPEVSGRTDLPDNEPVTVSEIRGEIVLTAPIEKPTGLQREIGIRLDAGVARLRHVVRNEGTGAVRCAPWCLSVMSSGGVGFFPQQDFLPHSVQLLPSRPLVLWGYTDMSDERWTWGRRLIRLRQLPKSEYQKVGTLVTQGWAAYANRNELFVKTFGYDPAATYPDFGCNFETFTREEMLELESLGPLLDLAPGGQVEHFESWRLVRPFELSERDDEVLSQVLPIVAEMPS
jgi:hypothetical protein